MPAMANFPNYSIVRLGGRGSACVFCQNAMSHQGTGMARLDDVAEREEWTDAINSVIAFEGTGVADDILTEVVAAARRSGAKIPFAAHTAYINTILPEKTAGSSR